MTAQGAGGFQGEAHFFTRSGQTWEHQVEVTSSDGESGDFFGFNADIDGDTAVIAADGDDDYTGAAYVFNRQGNSWVETQKLTDSNGAPSDALGSDVAVSGRNILVSKGQFDDLEGSAILYTRGGNGDYEEVGEFVADDTGVGDFFANGIDLHGNWAIAGAFRADVDGLVDSGAAYIFKINVVNAALQEAAALAVVASDVFVHSDAAVIESPTEKIASFDFALEREYHADVSEDNESKDETDDFIEAELLALLSQP